MGLQLKIGPRRTLTIRGFTKEILKVQRINATTHSYIMHIQLNASDKLPPKLPIVLYESADFPKRLREQLPNYLNVNVYWSWSGPMSTEIAKQWTDEVFLENFEIDSVLNHDKIVQLPPDTTERLLLGKTRKYTVPFGYDVVSIQGTTIYKLFKIFLVPCWL